MRIANPKKTNISGLKVIYSYLQTIKASCWNQPILNIHILHHYVCSGWLMTITQPELHRVNSIRDDLQILAKLESERMPYFQYLCLVYETTNDKNKPNFLL